MIKHTLRDVLCPKLEKGNMIERQFPLKISDFIKITRNRAIEIAEENNDLELGGEYYWTFIWERISFYRRFSEKCYAIKLAEKYKPIEYKFINKKKVYFFTKNNSTND
ncbi:MAG: hypothetical protein GF317_09960 [Candidatus Lokiarchaeota archaeon]|nr:hypothetical protein [Candidatus Lokiarchaeota archaeon]